MRVTKALVALAFTLVASGCAKHSTSTANDGAPTGTAPPLVVGTFADDYGSTYQISRTDWRQDTKTRYHIVEWHADSSYVIAQNAPANESDGNKWTRIDWMPLSGTAPYTWGYCLSAYDAPSKAAAVATHVAQRANPRNGCNGFPFSRMKPFVNLPAPRSPSQEFIP